MTPERAHAKPTLVTGAAGSVGSVGRNLAEMLIAKGHKVRALVRQRLCTSWALKSCRAT
jgi:nucleoside-diphosphate-sugar epimerase